MAVSTILIELLEDFKLMKNVFSLYSFIAVHDDRMYIRAAPAWHEHPCCSCLAAISRITGQACMGPISLAKARGGEAEVVWWGLQDPTVDKVPSGVILALAVQ